MNFPTGDPIIVVAFLWTDEFPQIETGLPHLQVNDGSILVLISHRRLRFRPVDDR
jgi:hypothetical protein